jgi:hypothetical protein
MSFTVPVFVPFNKGLDVSKESTLGPAELVVAENVDYVLDGSVRGRPARSAPKQFLVRDPASLTGGMLAAAAFNATGFNQRGLLRLRDMTGERAALGCDGRLFVQEGATHWMDKGPFASARADRVANHANNLTGSTRDAVAQDFGPARVAGGQWYNLLTSSFALERQVHDAGFNIASGAYSGNSARSGSVTATVAVHTTTNGLRLTTRTNGAAALTVTTLATDCRTPDDNGDAPSICSDFGVGQFYIAYRTTTANTFKVLRVDTAGTILNTYTSGTVAGLHGIWVCNTADKTLVAFTHDGGLTIRELDRATLGDTGLDKTHDGSDGLGLPGRDVVIGCQDENTAWWAFRNTSPTGDGDIVVGAAVVGATTIARARKYFGGEVYVEASIRWSIAHQPITAGGRCYLSLVASTNRDTTGTWITLDLTNWFVSAVGTGPFGNPTLVARGATEATIPHFQPASASLLPDGKGFTFATLDWSRFELNASGSTVGLDASLGVNRVTPMGARSAVANQSTVFSGSIPHHVAGGYCAELGFPFLGGEPGLSVDAVSGGAVGIGDYGITACWRWTDEAGQIHRSAPSIIRTLAIPGGGTNTIRAVVTNPWLTEKQYGDLKIEVYSTEVDSTADGAHYLIATVTPNFAQGYTSVDINTQPTDGKEILYTDGGVFPHYHVPGDGGVATVGRRLWMAGASAVYASKLLIPGFAPGFNDEGSLQIDLPAGAGRVIALESLDDKLIVFCERGIWMIQDGGPDNTRLGPDFAPPMQISELSLAGPRSCVRTDDGVVFCTTPDPLQPDRGGPWKLDRQSLQYIGRPVRDYFATSTVPEIAYSPERQQLYITSDVGGAGIVMIDLRTGRWGWWNLRQSEWGAVRSLVSVGGVVTALSNEPAAFDLTPGSDAGAGDYAMTLRTSHMASNGQQPLGWARVRSVSTLSGQGSQAHTLQLKATLDATETVVSDPYIMTTPGTSVEWPRDRQSPEWRLPTQKCSTIQVEVTASPARAVWAALLLEVAPLKGRAPARQRS